MTWLEVQITTTLEAEEAIVNLFYEVGAKGVVIESGENLMMIQEDPTINYIDERILNMDPDVSIVRGYFNEKLDCDECIHQLLTGIKRLPACGLNPGECELSITEVEEDDWANSWKKYYKPTRVGKSIIIKPTWEDYTPEADEIVVNMDPGMAFGTGTHETTALCLAALDELVKGGERVLDIGTGSGILAIAALKLGAAGAEGVDIDPMCVRTAGENAKLNGVDGKLKVLVGDLSDKAIGKYDIITANIVANAILHLAPCVPALLAEGGTFIASGIIDAREEEVCAGLAAAGLKVAEVRRQGGWVAILCKGGV